MTVVTSKNVSSVASKNRYDRSHWITVRGARTHNLRTVTVRVPKHEITVFTGVSGSGKSSLAFDTIAAEAQRLVSASFPVFVQTRLPQYPPPDVDSIDGLTFTTTVDQRRFGGQARSTLGTASDVAPLLRMLFSRVGHPSAGYSPAYSFNDPSGMCPHCEGLGTVQNIDLDQLLDPTKSLNEGAICFPTFAPGTFRWARMVRSGLADPDTPWSNLPTTIRHTLLSGEGLKLAHPLPGYPKHGVFDGVLPRLHNLYLRQTPSSLSDAEREALARIVTRRTCPECGGTRLNGPARASLIDGRSIADWASTPLRDLVAIARAAHTDTVAPLVDTITDRLQGLVDVGLGYLSLDRGASTLSGGEAQRVKIVRHLGSALSEATYVFDEPSVGLHPHDISNLTVLLRKLRDAHNTVLVVEHNPQIIASADHVIDLGPGAGSGGGTVLFEGTPSGLSVSLTPTGQYLREKLTVNGSRRTPPSHLTVARASLHNLRDVTVDIPLCVLTAVSGVAGSGKSSLFGEVLPAQHPQFTVVGRSALRGSHRSAPTTLLGVATPLRRRFAETSGLAPSSFSAKGKGACPQCHGRGMVVTDLAFLDDVRTLCEACGGTGFSQETLAAKYHGHSIADVLAMGPHEVGSMFADVADIVDPLEWMSRVGLGYMAIGQSLDTCSGGEIQRLSLARELAASSRHDHLHLVLDEPTAGLHPCDVKRLLGVFDDLVDQGATVVVIEHNQRVIAHADHVIEFGPGAGTDGGRVVFEGPPRGLVRCGSSPTGHYLREALRR